MYPYSVSSFFPDNADVEEVAGTTFTPSDAMAGGIKILTSATGVAVKLPKTAVKGYAICLVQGGAGQITVATEAGGTLRHADSYSKTRKQWASLTAFVASNVGGASAFWVLSGDMVA